jgi:hypothetical protein
MNEMEMFASDHHLWRITHQLRATCSEWIESRVWNELKRGVQTETITHQIAVRTGVGLYFLREE